MVYCSHLKNCNRLTLSFMSCHFASFIHRLTFKLLNSKCHCITITYFTTKFWIKIFVIRGCKWYIYIVNFKFAKKRVLLTDFDKFQLISTNFNNILVDCSIPRLLIKINGGPVTQYFNKGINTSMAIRFWKRNIYRLLHKLLL